MYTITLDDMLSHSSEGVTATYLVTRLTDAGDTSYRVEITVDFEALKSLARRAVINTSGTAGLHYGAIIAKVQK
jgi:hypothetical protein